MKWRVVVEPAAQQDLIDPLEYLTGAAPDVIPRFRRTVRQTMRLICERPFLSREHRPNRRHRLTGIFPYHVWYAVDEAKHTVHILRVLHVRRDSGPLVPR